eukprot:SAG11_NODE_219_length_12168_cov_5.600083_4_plen_105_part_00
MSRHVFLTVCDDWPSFTYLYGVAGYWISNQVLIVGSMTGALPPSDYSRRKDDRGRRRKSVRSEHTRRGCGSRSDQGGGETTPTTGQPHPRKRELIGHYRRSHTP